MGLFYKAAPRLAQHTVFPPVDLADADGFLAYGGELNQDFLLDAYSHGIFPWPHPQYPMLWFAPDPRCILLPGDFKISRRSQRKISHSNFTITFNSAFHEVISACAMPLKGREKTWISQEIIAAYNDLFFSGYAQSVEVWQANTLAGGLYGVCMGKAFFGESMFHFQPEASRAALQALVAEAKRLGFLFIDCQQVTPHMLAMGATTIRRLHFQKLLSQALC